MDQVQCLLSAMILSKSAAFFFKWEVLSNNHHHPLVMF